MSFSLSLFRLPSLNLSRPVSRSLGSVALGGCLLSTLACGPRAQPKAEASEGKEKEAEADTSLVGYDLRRIRPREESLATTFDRMFERARGEGQRVAVLFSADWCEPCRRMEVELGNLHPKAAIGDVRIFLLKEEDWSGVARMNEFNDLRRRWYAPLGSYPVMLLLDGQGKLREEMKDAIDRLEGEGLEPTLPMWFSSTRA